MLIPKMALVFKNFNFFKKFCLKKCVQVHVPARFFRQKFGFQSSIYCFRFHWDWLNSEKNKFFNQLRHKRICYLMHLKYKCTSGVVGLHYLSHITFVLCILVLFCYFNGMKCFVVLQLFFSHLKDGS